MPSGSGHYEPYVAAHSHRLALAGTSEAKNLPAHDGAAGTSNGFRGSLHARALRCCGGSAPCCNLLQAGPPASRRLFAGWPAVSALAAPAAG